jgi:hypothetical protein
MILISKVIRISVATRAEQVRIVKCAPYGTAVSARSARGSHRTTDKINFDGTSLITWRAPPTDGRGSAVALI